MSNQIQLPTNLANFARASTALLHSLFKWHTNGGRFHPKPLQLPAGSKLAQEAPKEYPLSCSRFSFTSQGQRAMASTFALRLGPRLAAPPPARATSGGGGGGSRPPNRRALVSKKPNKHHHLWIRKDSAGSGKKALCLVNTVSKLPNEKEAVYGALDRWTAFEPEFPIIAAAKALVMLKKRRKWLQIIQVTKWLMSKGQMLTWTTYDTLLLALFMDGRVDEVESIWNTIIQTYTRSVPKKLFSRMIQIYSARHLPDKVLEIYGDMEELGVHPDEDTTRRIGRAFAASGQEDKQKPVLEKYLKKWKYIHFNGERVRVKRAGPLA